jgi:hypothetical protein
MGKLLDNKWSVFTHPLVLDQLTKLTTAVALNKSRMLENCGRYVTLAADGGVFPNWRAAHMIAATMFLSASVSEV